jgi:phosphopantothenoylcysteine synthetase/decarboxylase
MKLDITNTSPLKNKKILITCGPTWIPIDDTRIISNKSTGFLGQIMAQDLHNCGARVNLLEGPVTSSLESFHIRVTKFFFYDEFYRLMKKELKKNYDIVIHAAAVSDYKLDKPFKTKLKSKVDELTLKLTPTRKIIHLIKEINPKTFLVGFKLESIMNKSSAKTMSEDLFEKAKCDLVIANSSVDQKYLGYILNKNYEFLAQEKSRDAISKSLVKILEENL